MASLLQISDPHFGTEQPPVVAGLLALANELEPNVIVFSGDITQRARAAQFAAAAQFAKQLPTRNIVAIPGNHDIPLFNVMARAFNPYDGFKNAFGENLEPEFSNEALRVICVNTTRPKRHKDGEVSADQVERVCAVLKQARPEQLRIVVVHQPVHVIRSQDIENLLHGHIDAVRAWSQAGADIVMGGHIHLPYVRALNDHIVGLHRRIWTVQAGTAVSHRVRYEAPNSVNVLRYEAGAPACVVEQWNYSATKQSFECGERIEMGIERGRGDPVI